jgi:hypothetical protein
MCKKQEVQMFSKAKLFFVVDALILMAFLASAISGLVLFAVPHGGYQGGRNADFAGGGYQGGRNADFERGENQGSDNADVGQTVFFLSRDSWNDIHVWGSLAMMGGIVVHLALHWKWIAHMLKKTLVPRRWGGSLGTAKPVPIAVTDVEN